MIGDTELYELRDYWQEALGLLHCRVTAEIKPYYPEHGFCPPRISLDIRIRVDREHKLGFVEILDHRAPDSFTCEKVEYDLVYMLVMAKLSPLRSGTEVEFTATEKQVASSLAMAVMGIKRKAV